MAAEERHTETESRIRAAMAQLLGGDIPEGLKCDVKSLCTLSEVPRATLYRSYPHIKAEFERARSTAHAGGLHPDPRKAQIERLKTEIIDLHKRLDRGNAELTELREFRGAALSRLTAQHDELTSLRRELATTATANIRGLTSRQQH
jgi:chromosome segregation ATPase